MGGSSRATAYPTNISSDTHTSSSVHLPTLWVIVNPQHLVLQQQKWGTPKHLANVRRQPSESGEKLAPKEELVFQQVTKLNLWYSNRSNIHRYLNRPNRLHAKSVIFQQEFLVLVFEQDAE